MPSLRAHARAFWLAWRPILIPAGLTVVGSSLLVVVLFDPAFGPVPITLPNPLLWAARIITAVFFVGGLLFATFLVTTACIRDFIDFVKDRAAEHRKILAEERDA